MSSRGQQGSGAPAPARPTSTPPSPPPVDPVDPVDLLLQQLRTRLADADPPALRSWWGGLSDVERQALIIDSPELVGAAAGVPPRHRDEANRLRLLGDLARWGDADQDGVLAPPGCRVLAAARVLQRQAESRAQAPVLMLLYRPDAAAGTAETALSLGDPDQAEDVVALTEPGWDLAALATVRDRAEVPTAVVGWRGSGVALRALLDGLRAGRDTAAVTTGSIRPFPR